MPEELIIEAEVKMEQAIAVLAKEYTLIRTTRANPRMLDRVVVDYYGTLTPINQLAAISVPEAMQIYIKPYDKSLVSKIERAIFAANLGMTPSNDGNGIRIILPPLTEENRKESVKQARKMAEDSKVAIRNIRRDVITDIKKKEKDKLITEDDVFFYSDEIQKSTDQYIEKIDQVFLEKEKEIMSI